MDKIFLCFISLFLCLNLGNAQILPPVATTSTPASIPVVAPSSPTSTPAAVSPIPTILGSINSTAGKYEEYQSICRFNEYDQTAYLDADQQLKRIADLNEKIKANPPATKLKIKLLKEYIDQRKYPDAEKYYASLKEEKLSDPEEKMADAVYSIIRRDFRRAASTLSKVVLEDAKNRDALEYLAEIYKMDLNYFEATAAYYDLAKLTKDNFDLELCEIQTLDSQHKDAEKTCKKAAQKYEKNPYPLIYLGVSQREQLNYSEARRYFKESVERKKTEMGYTCLGEIFYLKENYTGAAELFKWASMVSPASSRANLGLAWSQFKAKKAADALVTFKAACAKDRRVVVEIRKAFKTLTDEKSSLAKQFADAAQRCTEAF